MEIQKKINEVKYLVSQKKVPRLSLHKEIIHLENKLQGIFELEHKLVSQNKKESAKVAALKQKITHLQQRLVACEEKDLQKKVDKLSYLLAEYAAGKKVREELVFQDKRKSGSAPQEKKQEQIKAKVALLRQQVQNIKQELATKQVQGKDLALLQKKILLIEQKLRQYQQGNPDITPMPIAAAALPQEIKHTLRFDAPVLVEAIDMELERQLPLPPPPRMMKKG